MIALLLATSLLNGSEAIGPRNFEVPPRPLEWEQLSPRVFDFDLVLPDRPPAEARDLVAEMRRLLDLRFEIQNGDGPPLTCLGDLIVEVQARHGRARIDYVEGLQARAPELWNDWGAGLSQLLLDGRLHSDGWKPGVDHRYDGILLADGWEVPRPARGPWSELDVPLRVEEVAALIHADMATIKAAENDYGAYRRHVGADYEEINPLPGNHYRGEDPNGRPFSVVAMKFRCDIPFPFSDYTVGLRILNRFDEDGTARTEIYSTSSDFHWFAGRDIYLPVQDSRGNRVSYLLVRRFGFDIDGVPDKPKHRLEALRSTVGNLKRTAEESYAARGAADGPVDGDLPNELTDFRVLGWRR